jgi:hypothetical protein
VYQKAIVTFLDILGFADVVRKRDHAAVSTILDSLEQFTVPEAEEEPAYEPEVIAFSDSIVRVRKIATKTNSIYPFGLLFNEILDLVHAQGMLIDAEVFLRGGIAFGDISMLGKRVFGPALVSTYELESKYAQYPRIIVSPSLFHELKVNPLLVAAHHDSDTEISFIRDMLRQGDDGMWFIDYGRAIERELDEPEMYPFFLKKHRALIVRRARQFKSSGGVLAKYLWLANYHNRLVREINSKWFHRYKIKKRRLLITLNKLPTLESK